MLLIGIMPSYPCRAFGCNMTGPRKNRYCELHTKIADATVPATPSMAPSRAPKSPLYQTARWRKYSRYRLSNHPICEECLARAATCTDHITPIELGGAFWEPTNHQSLCDACHARKRAKERQLHRLKYAPSGTYEQGGGA